MENINLTIQNVQVIFENKCIPDRFGFSHVSTVRIPFYGIEKTSIDTGHDHKQGNVPE